MRRTFTLSMVCLLWLSISGIKLVNAQESESPVTFGADIVSRYIWRGLNLGGNTPSIQPSITWNIGKSGLSLGAWGAFSYGEQLNQETDLVLSYTTPNEMFSATISDYFFPSDGGGYDYFDYGDETGHLMEGVISFNGTDKFPISLLFAMNFFGADAVNEDGDIVMSKYVELGYSKTMGDVDFSAFIGAALDKADVGTGFYGQEKAGIVNLGIGLSKSITITESFSLPVSATLITNPTSKSIFMVFGISL